MRTRWWCGGALVVLCAALGGCASAPARADSVATAAQAAQSVQAVTMPPAGAPGAAPLEPPTDGQTAFIDGYRAYQNHDDARAIARLEFAAGNFPALGDYALYYL